MGIQIYSNGNTNIHQWEYKYTVMGIQIYSNGNIGIM